MPRALKISPEELSVYRITARRRWEIERQELARREERAWDVARRAATVLKEHFGAERVVVFGSLVHKGCFTPWSDVDIAAWGIRPEDTFRAMSAVQEVDPELEVNLVDTGACRSSLLRAIDQEGIAL